MQSLCWDRSYDVKIDLCEVNLTRAQLAETWQGQRQAPEDELFPGVKRSSFLLEFLYALRFPQGQNLQLAKLPIPTTGPSNAFRSNPLAILFASHHRQLACRAARCR